MFQQNKDVCPTLRQKLRRAFKEGQYGRFLIKSPGYRRMAQRYGLKHFMPA